MLLDLSLQLPHPPVGGIQLMSGVDEGIVERCLVINGSDQLVAQRGNFVS